MHKDLKWKWTLFFAAVAVAAAMPLAAKPAATDAPAVPMTITAVGKKDTQPPPLTKNDVQLYEGKERVQVADWKRGETLFLAVLIDDSLESDVANQWGDLKAFFMAQPESTYIAVGYGRNGAAMIAQDFTKDHALAAKALRIPVGNAGAFTSPYLALQDWMKRWPESRERKSIMLFSSGVSIPLIPISIPRSRARRNRTSTFGRFTFPMPGTSAAVSSACSTRNQTSAAFRKRQAPNLTISVLARRSR
jgi:hypothetical protein